MKIPIDWLKEYVETNKTPEEIAESFTSLGLLLDKPISGNVMDLEHRMDRSDWLSIIGCARDFAAFENLELKLPPNNTKKGKDGGSVEIRVEAPEICRRFNTRVFRGVRVQESPDWLKKRLSDYGMTPVNNIVDVTNYVMIEYGNPMHAQDLDKFEKQEIVIRKARKGEQIVTLDGTNVILDDSMFVLSQNNEAIVIGGVVGGAKTAVDFITSNIVLDTGNYDQANVRRTARKLKIQNETVSRYDKFLHPENTQIAVERATYLILELAGGEYYENDDYYPKPVPAKKMELRLERILSIGGIEFEPEPVKRILVSLGYTVIEERKGSFFLEVPYFRTDVVVEDDIVSDILRISNYNYIPSDMADSAPPKEITPGVYTFEETLRDALVNLGLHEHITDPLVPHDKSIKTQVWLDNSKSADKNALRTTIYETLLPVTQVYYKHGLKEAEVFEIGKVYKHSGEAGDINAYSEPRLATVIYRNRALSTYEISRKTRELLSGLFLILGVGDYKVEKQGDVHIITIGGTSTGYISYDSFTLDVEVIMNTSKTNTRVLHELINTITEDVSLNIEAGREVGDIINKIRQSDPKINKVEVVEEYFDITEDRKSILVRMYFNAKHTNQKEINSIKNRVLEKLEL
ncbi:hypothetical protein A2976_02910 [candidate division WWE3 bacterium RIFCSPLOWO2_01_FULL_41_9]|uniref:phenylalanine--tRNA ligase n=1 Tax=candidate division WWE3 bacterium RIFCSPLOWO2_01_FULL_41_9 TaxID=1802626 RepID=A0A1F4VGT9_UNCKA|nr:MAG: hypothetical protein A2976_02910 [candidate division WWE3 bacterium RIFCSPLOWO2_01_FULL_41_9]